ncbi:MAG: hypothetical protein ACPL7O_10490, partial [Armatimonadota bacterium]
MAGDSHHEFNFPNRKSPSRTTHIDKHGLCLTASNYRDTSYGTYLFRCADMSERRITCRYIFYDLWTLVDYSPVNKAIFCEA